MNKKAVIKDPKEWAEWDEQITSATNHLTSIAETLEANKSTPKQLHAAFNIWLEYPFLRDCVPENGRNTEFRRSRTEQIEHHEGLLHDVHVLAGRVIASHAEHFGIDSSRILRSGEYCRTLLARDHAKYYRPEHDHDRTWPKCLGNSADDLPQDVRAVIFGGHDDAERLDIRVQNESKLNLPAIKTHGSAVSIAAQAESDSVAMSAGQTEIAAKRAEQQKPVTGGTKPIKPEDQAIAIILREDPGITIKELAARLGCHRTTIYTWKTFMPIYERQKDQSALPNRILRGTKADGLIEAKDE